MYRHKPHDLHHVFVQVKLGCEIQLFHLKSHKVLNKVFINKPSGGYICDDRNVGPYSYLSMYPVNASLFMHHKFITEFKC